MSAPRRAPLSVIVLTFNEARNIERTLSGLAEWTDRVFVVDSGSTDRTVDLAVAHGADVVTHPFESHARQWQWALSSLPLTSPWILGLDADQAVTPELRESIERALSGSDREAPPGYYVPRRLIFRGRWLRHGGLYPKYQLKLFRRDAVQIDPADRVDHHFTVAGRAGRLRGDLVEDNRNESRIADWVTKHNRYARLQAAEDLAIAADSRRGRFFGQPDDRVRWLKRRWASLPPYIRPWIYFIYRYVIRLGCLDGRQGFTFHFMQALWYRTLVDINRDELLASGEGPAPASETVPAGAAGQPRAVLDGRSADEGL